MATVSVDFDTSNPEAVACGLIASLDAQTVFFQDILNLVLAVRKDIFDHSDCSNEFLANIESLVLQTQPFTTSEWIASFTVNDRRYIRGRIHSALALLAATIEEIQVNTELDKPMVADLPTA